LLGIAGLSEDATLLIPDLQRPYIWDPNQVVVLVDSLIRGWPFGTLLTWRVKQDDPARELARSFWHLIDRTGADDGLKSGTKHPPATFEMVLDGQQRVQSLLLAFGGDGWGFKLLDRQWHELLNGTKPRGPRGRSHWSLGCLSVDVPALCAAYAITKRATAIDYTGVLRWVITDDATGQSRFEKPSSYIEPLDKVSSIPGRFLRLSRLWHAAPEQAGIDSYEAEELASKILEQHGVSKDIRNEQKRPTGALLLALRDVKQTRVTYLELAGYDELYGTREVYNDAIVNIFTRLNTAGRTLTREDITFAWLKIGWKTNLTGNASAKSCIDDLIIQLKDLLLPISVEEVVSAISLVWAITFNSGRLLSNNDLMKGEAIRPMAANVSENWDLSIEAITRVSAHARDRGLRFNEQFQSMNAIAYLWAWYFVALRWGHEHKLKELQKDSLQKSLAATLDALMDRWLICSQWAGVWATSSVQNLAGYAARLAECTRALAEKEDVAAAVATLTKQLEAEVKGLEQDAVNGLNAMNAEDRQYVRIYYSPLWVWNRLEKNRWEKAKLALRQQGRRHNRLDVDHIVAWDLWQSKIEELKKRTKNEEPPITEELITKANELGNCMLLEKNFNISKSNKPLKEFLDQVHEFMSGQIKIEQWSAALDLRMPQVDSGATPVDKLQELFNDRTQKIRSDLEQFIRGRVSRIDVLLE